jgi:hypothetical protein
VGVGLAVTIVALALILPITFPMMLVIVPTVPLPPSLVVIQGVSYAHPVMTAAEIKDAYSLLESIQKQEKKVKCMLSPQPEAWARTIAET